MAAFSEGTLVFFSDYGEVPPSQEVGTFNDHIIGDVSDLPVLNSPGKKFDGWFSSPDFQEEYRVYSQKLTSTGMTYTVIVTPGYTSGDYKLYAKWIWDDLFISGTLLYNMAEHLRRISGDSSTYTPAQIATGIENLLWAEEVEF